MKIYRLKEAKTSQLTSLEGVPRTIGGSFYCYSNPNLHSLDGLREIKGEIFKAF